jgi:hypothetical protein
MPVLLKQAKPSPKSKQNSQNIFGFQMLDFFKRVGYKSAYCFYKERIHSVTLKIKIMIKYFKMPAALFISAVLFLVSCSKPAGDPTTPPDTTTANLTAALTTGKWAVSSFIEKTEDKTSKFSDIVFAFSADGTVTATSKNGSSTKGSWHYTPAVTYYGSTSKAAIALNIGAGNPLDLLTKTWNFISSTSTTLNVDSPELLEDKHVQFSKL